MTNHAKLLRLSDVARSGKYADLITPPTIPTHLTDLDTTVSGATLNSMQASINNVLGLSNLIAPGAYTSGNYYFCNSPGNNGTSITLGNNILRVSPMQVSISLSITKLWIDISVLGEANSVFRVGIYADTGTGRPGALVLDCGTISTGTGNAGTVATIGGVASTNEIAAVLTLAPGRYWVGGAVQGASTTQPTLRTSANADLAPTGPLGSTLPVQNVVSRGFAQTAISGALPDPFNAAAGVSSAVPHMGYKVA